MDWAEQQANKIAEAEAQRRKEQEWQLHVAKRIQAEAPAFFSELIARIEEHVAIFNRARGETSVEVSREDPVRFGVRKGSYPIVYVSVAFHPDRSAVSTDETRYRTSLDAGKRKQADFKFSLDSQGHILLDSIGVEDFARRVLEPVFDAFRPSDRPA